MRPSKIYSTFVIVVVLFEACNNSSAPENPRTSSQDISAYLPLHIGNTWEYSFDNGSERAVIEKKILDTLRHTDGSLLFAYNEDVKVNNPPPNPWISGYNVYRNSTIYSYNSPTETYLGVVPTSKVPLLKGPLNVGYSWAYSDSQSFAIAYTGPYSFDTTTIDTAVLVVRRSGTAYVDSSWFGRDIGLLKKRIHYFSQWDTTRTTWDLRSYLIVR